MNTGYEVKDYSQMKDSVSPTSSEAKKTPMKTVYPDITLRGPAADAILAAHKAGDEFTATVTFHVSRSEKRDGTPKEWESDEEANRTIVELEVRAIEAEGVKDAENDGEEEAGDAVDSYLKGKSAPPDEED